MPGEPAAGRGPAESPEPPEPVPMVFRGGEFAPKTYPLAGWLTLAAIVLVWHVAALAQADFTILPKPAEVWGAFLDLGARGELVPHITASLGRLALGWGLGAGFGVAAGFAIGLNPVARSSLLPVVSVLFAMPKIALLPLFIIWLGIGEASKIATIAVGVFSPMAVAVYSGVDGVDRNLIRMAQCFDLTPRSIIFKILLPGALPAILTGVRMSAAIAIVLLVGAEMIAAQHGIGALAMNSGGLMRTDRVFVAVGLLGLCGLIVSLTVGLAERILLRWR
jgi:ABC-type nitrate/sulfonate/bicarbonate transport system permease component